MRECPKGKSKRSAVADNRPPQGGRGSSDQHEKPDWLKCASAPLEQGLSNAFEEAFDDLYRLSLQHHGYSAPGFHDAPGPQEWPGDSPSQQNQNPTNDAHADVDVDFSGWEGAEWDGRPWLAEEGEQAAFNKQLVPPQHPQA